MRFSQDFIEKVREANNLVEIISQYTELRGTADHLMGRCPFPEHKEKTPSFSVSESKQLYHCFGCKKSGNLFTFLKEYNGYGFVESIEFLAKRASIVIPAEEGRKAKAGGDGRDLLLQINRWAGHYFHQQLGRLAKDHPAVLYVEKRGLSVEIVEKFRIGVAIDAWEGLVTFFAQKKIPLLQAESLGLVKRRKSTSSVGDGYGDGYFDLFRERLMFPIFSPTDEVLGFGGRSYGDQQPKYINSPESVLFSKGRVLYGLHETGRYIRAEDHAIVVEGYMDALALYSAGIKNVVAILGTALTADHAKILKRYTANVTLLLDGDEAGMRAAERSLPILLQAEMLVKGAFLPGGLDPDDFIREKGADSLREELAKAPDLFNLVLGRLMSEYRGTASEKIRLVEETFPILRVMLNFQLRELYVGEMARRLDVEHNWLNRAFRAAAQKEKEKQAANPKGTGVARDGLPGLETNVSSMPMNQGINQTHQPVSREIVSREAVSRETASREEVAEPEASADDDMQISCISVKGAPRDEAFVLSLILHNERLFREARDMQGSPLVEQISHYGLKQAFNYVFDKYRQSPESFDKLAASLASQIDLPSIVTCSMEVTRHLVSRSEESAGASLATNDAEERRLMTDYVNAIQKRYLKERAKALANQLRDKTNPEMYPETLEQFMNIQKVRRSLERE